MIDGHNMAEDATLLSVIVAFHQSPIQLPNYSQCPLRHADCLTSAMARLEKVLAQHV